MAAAGTAEYFLDAIVLKWKYGKRESGKGDGSYLLFQDDDLRGSRIHVHIGVEGTNLFCHITDRRINPETGQREERKKPITMTVEPNSQGRDAVIKICLSEIPIVKQTPTLNLALGGVTGKITIIRQQAAEAAPAPDPSPIYMYKCSGCGNELRLNRQSETFMHSCFNCVSKRQDGSLQTFTRGARVQGKRRKSGRKSGRQSRRKLGRKSRQ